jgi:hypothetical protein
VITIINNLWNQPTVAEEEKLKSIKSLVFVSTHFKQPTKHKERGQILHITPHSLDCSRVNDELWVLPLTTIKDIEKSNPDSVHVGDCQSCQGRVVTCLEGESTTTHEFLTHAIALTTIEIETEYQIGPIKAWVGNESGIAKLSHDTGYHLLNDFNDFECELAGTHSASYRGLKVKHISLDSARLERFRKAMGNTLGGNVLAIGASVISTIDSKLMVSTDSIYLQPVWLPDQTQHEEPEQSTRLLFVMKLRGEYEVNLGFLPMEVEESPSPATVLQLEWTTMRAGINGSGQLLLEKPMDFAVFSQANQLIMRIPPPDANQGELVYLLIEMVMNKDDIPDKLMTSVSLPLGLTASTLIKGRRTFAPTDAHLNLLKQSCGTSASKKSNPDKSKRKDHPEVTTPAKKLKKTSSKNPTLKPETVAVDDSSEDSEETETGNS